MPAKASTAKRKTSAGKRSTKKASPAKRAVAKAGNAVRKAAKNPGRTATQAVDKVQQGATRARGVGEKVVAAGLLIEKVADAVNQVAASGRGRQTTGTTKRAASRKKSTATSAKRTTGGAAKRGRKKTQ